MLARQPVLFRTNQPVLFRTNQPVLFRTSMFVCLFVYSVLSPVSSTSLWLGMGNVLTAKPLKLLFINNLSVYCLLLLLLLSLLLSLFYYYNCIIFIINNIIIIIFAYCIIINKF